MLFCRVCEECIDLRLQLMRAESKIESLNKRNAEKIKIINDLEKELKDEKGRHALLQSKIKSANVNIEFRLQ